jgi:hypothetical protein
VGGSFRQRVGATAVAVAAAAALVVGVLPTPAAAGDLPGTRTVSFRGVTVQVPDSWPVRALAGRAGCVRFDRHAVYLGDPSRSTCPPHLVGRTEAVHLTTGSLQGVVAPDRVVTADGSTVGVVVSAGDDPALARRIARSVSYAHSSADVTAPSGLADARTFAAASSTPSSTADSSSSATTTGTPRSPSDTVFSGLGFDACTAQPLTTMSTWYSASPYKAANMYIGGASRGCAQANLTADWVTQTIAQGWTLIPTYVGLQASCTAFPNRIDPAQAAAQGSAAADDAIAQLNALGLGIGNPVYFDLEAFSYSNAPCLAAAQTFIDQWTVRLHARGYVSGVYSSSNTIQALLVNRQGDATFHQPDDLWFARWNGNPATTGDPAVPDQYWADHQRIHQYQGGHQETWGGITVNIDNDAVDAAVAPSQLAAEGAFVQIAGRGELYRIAGGAPIYVSSWESVGGTVQPVQTLSQTQFDSLPDRPEDGTFLSSGATGLIWRTVKGVATFVPSWAPYGGPKPTIVVDQAALDNAGTGGVWNLLTSGKPAPPRMTGPTTLGTVLAQTRFSWFGGNTSSAVATYDVRFRKARWDGGFGAWIMPASWQGTSVTNTPLGLRAGYDYCVSVRARNRAGQLSDWSGQRCLARALDDKRLSVSSGWKRKSASTFYSGSALATTSRGATLVRTGAKVKRVGLVATTCRTCGKVAVLVDGRRVGRVNLSSPIRHRRQVFMLPAVKLGPATITLRVVTSGLTVQVDGLVLSRT